MPDGSIDQHSADAAAVSSPGPRVRARRAPPPLNLRFSVPLPGSRFYIAIAGGRERRSRERLALERRVHRLGTPSNVLFIVIGALTFYVMTLGAFLGWAAISGI